LAKLSSGIECLCALFLEGNEKTEHDFIIETFQWASCGHFLLALIGAPTELAQLAYLMASEKKESGRRFAVSSIM
jgi:hypothetical protein